MAMRWPWPFRTETKQTEAEILQLLGIGVETSAGIAISPEGALRVPAVAAAVRTISEACASLSCSVVEIGEGRSETPVPDHPVNDFLQDAANDWTSSFELIRTLVVDALTRDPGGLAYVNWTNGNPVEIIRYRPGYISADLTRETGEPIYRIQGRVLPAQHVLHVRSTFDKSPVTLCREAIAVAIVMERHAARLFGHGARPGGVIQMQKSVGDDGAKRMLAAWKAAMEGADNSGKTGLLWDGATWNQMTLNSVDSQFQQLRIFQLQEIARAFNIPAVLIGELSRATWSNSAEMQKLFLMVCLEPWLMALEGALRRALFVKEDRKRYAIRFERDDFSKVDLAVLATAINSLVASRVLNPNEAREWLDMPKGPGELNAFANPNTGASQPGQAPASRPSQSPANDQNADEASDAAA